MFSTFDSTIHSIVLDLKTERGSRLKGLKRVEQGTTFHSPHLSTHLHIQNFGLLKENQTQYLELKTVLIVSLSLEEREHGQLLNIARLRLLQEKMLSYAWMLI